MAAFEAELTTVEKPNWPRRKPVVDRYFTDYEDSRIDKVAPGKPHPEARPQN